MLVFKRLMQTAATEIPKRLGNSGGNKKSVLWKVAVGFGVGTSLGGIYAYQKLTRKPSPILNNNDNPFALDKAPNFQPSKSVRFPNDTSGLKLTLYQYQTCPFCCKVRAMLNYFGISYDIVEVNPVLRTQLKWSEAYKKVPILIVETPEGEIFQLKDSTMIISCLYSYFSNKNKISKKEKNSLQEIVRGYPSVNYNDEKGNPQTEIYNKYFTINVEDPRANEVVLEERKWREWADNCYVHTLSPNIYRTLPEAIDSFRNFDQVGEWEKNFSSWERTLVIYVGAFAMWVIGKRLQKRHHLKDNVRESLYDESNFWVKNIEKKGGEFMGGKEPNLADLAVYGVLSSIEGCAAFNDLADHSQIVSKWYRKVQEHLKA